MLQAEGGGTAGGGGNGKNEVGSGHQAGLWANIHLLCDLLGGPLGQVGQLTNLTQTNQQPPNP